MSITTKFENFYTNIRISKENADNISYRYREITKRLNKDFWETESDVNHSLYVGSYGRDTDIHVSDIDIIFQLPYKKYKQYNDYNTNGQSALLQEVKKSIEKKYAITNIGADGQVIVIPFTDKITFELVPVFINKNDSYTFPDSNNGGSWKITNPRAEIKEIREKDNEWNGNLKRLSRMIRAWKENCNVPIGGLLIDTFCYNFLEDWPYKDKSFLYYDWMTRDFFDFLSDQDENQDYWFAPGSNQRVNRKGKFNYKAIQAYNRALEAISYESEEKEYSANEKWRNIYGSKF